MVDVDHLKQRIIGRYQTGWARMGERLEQRLRETGPVDSGELVQKTIVKPAGPLRLDVRVAVDYASFVKDGTNPHFIYPRNRSFLAFQWPEAPANMGRLPDGRVLARAVAHPGTEPNSWYDDVLDSRGELLEGILEASGL